MTNIAYNMDCMEAMKQFPDKYFDLAVVDPPYGIGADNFKNGAGASKDGGRLYSTAVKMKNRLNQGGGKLKNRMLNQSDCSWDSAPPSKEYFDELFRVCENCVIWGAITLIYLRPEALLFGIKYSRGTTSVRLNWHGLLLTDRQHCSRCAILWAARYIPRRSRLNCTHGFFRSMRNRA